MQEKLSLREREFLFCKKNFLEFFTTKRVKHLKKLFSFTSRQTRENSLMFNELASFAPEKIFL